MRRGSKPRRFSRTGNLYRHPALYPRGCKGARGHCKVPPNANAISAVWTPTVEHINEAIAARCS
jgi:hypothetical protein